MSKPGFRWIGVAVLVIAALFFFRYQQQQHAARNSQAMGLQASGADGNVLPSGAAMPTRAEAFSLETSSLRGTEVDGGVSLDAAGQVLPDLGMRRLFDYFLSLVGERDIPQIRQLLHDHLLSAHGPAMTEKALRYFDQYAAYLDELAALDIGGIGNPQERLEKVHELRLKMLGEPMASAFFAEEESLAALTVKRMAIAGDKTLDAEEKTRRLAELDGAQNYSARSEADTAALVAEQSRQLDAMKSSDAERAAEREATWGKEAAARLARLDEERARWDARVARYLQARSIIDANRGLSAAARAQAIARLRAQHFDAIEQRRVASLEAIGQLKPGG